MKITQINSKIEVIEYDSLHEFYEYLTKNPINEAFRNKLLDSVYGTYNFTKTKSFDEAVELFKNGWSDMAGKLVQKLKVSENKTQVNMVRKNAFDVCGYQAVVPLYLNGVPTNMINKKMTPIKQKVITMNKSIDYTGSTSSDNIINESIKAMQIIKKIEGQGYRCNLNLVLGTAKYDKQFIVKVRIKSANEKMNISKLAFPLVHPSMLRRLFFRFIEIYPKITSDFVYGYGRPATSSELRKIFSDEILLPNFINKNINEIDGVDDLENI